MGSWSDLHRASEAAAIAAEFAAKAGRFSESASLYANAAELEQAALGVIDTAKARTKAITGVSTAALWFKAAEYRKAAKVARGLLEDPATQAFDGAYKIGTATIVVSATSARSSARKRRFIRWTAILTAASVAPRSRATSA